MLLYWLFFAIDAQKRKLVALFLLQFASINIKTSINLNQNALLYIVGAIDESHISIKTLEYDIDGRHCNLQD